MRLRVLCGIGLLAFGAACSSSAVDTSAAAGRYPSRPVTIVCWSNPGSPNDLLARQLARIGERHFTQSLTVLTKAGGGGANAMAYLTRQRPDGYTLATVTSSQVISMASGLLPFSPDQFTYLRRIQVDPFLIAVRSDSRFTTLREFLSHARDHPGRLSVSGFGSASAHFLAFSRLTALAGRPDIRWIAYEGGADAAVAGLGGHIDAVHTNYSVLREHVKAGSMRVLAVSSARRLPMLPDVATYREQGYDIAPAHWRGIMGPAGMPADVVREVRQILDRTIDDPEFHAFMANAGETFPPPEDAAAFTQSVAAEIEDARRRLADLNLLATPDATSGRSRP